MGIDAIRFQGHVNPEFICSICEDVFKEPVQRPGCEHIFCRECIATWLLQEKNCPIDRHPLSKKDLEEVPRVFKSLLGSLQIQCEFQKKGCATVISLESVTAHSKECIYNPDPIMTCPRQCGFSSKRSDVNDTHECIAYLKNIIQVKDDEINRQNQSVVALNKEIHRLRHGESSTSAPSPHVIELISAQTRNASNGWISAQHRQAIERLKSEGVLKSPKVYESMLDVDLFHFYRTAAFTDGWDYGHAKNLEAVVPYLKPTQRKVLICNNFSGYFQACAALILGPECCVFSDIGEKGTDILRSQYNELLEMRRVIVLYDETVKRSAAPFDLIINFEHKWSDKYDNLVKIRGIIINPWKPKYIKRRLDDGTVMKMRIRPQ